LRRPPPTLGLEQKNGAGGPNGGRWGEKNIGSAEVAISP